MQKIVTTVLILASIGAIAQNTTDISMFLNKDSTQYLHEISSKTGDLFNELGHHGPAIENEWLGLRMFFNKTTAIDVYSKTHAGLELQEARWYPTAEQQKKGWGADYYKVGNTVGLGGISLWDGKEVIPLNPVDKRTARVAKEGTTSYLEMFSEGVPYKNTKVDVLVRVTVFSGVRKAKVEAFALTSEPIQFVTGVNYHPGQKIIDKFDRIIVWGLHPEDVAFEKIEIGAAMVFDPSSFVQKLRTEDQYLLISKPTKQLQSWVLSVSAKDFEINTFDTFVRLVEKTSNN